MKLLPWLRCAPRLLYIQDRQTKSSLLIFPFSTGMMVAKKATPTFYPVFSLDSAVATMRTRVFSKCAKCDDRYFWIFGVSLFRGLLFCGFVRLFYLSSSFLASFTCVLLSLCLLLFSDPLPFCILLFFSTPFPPNLLFQWCSYLSSFLQFLWVHGVFQADGDFAFVLMKQAEWRRFKGAGNYLLKVLLGSLRLLDQFCLLLLFDGIT